MSRGPGRWQRHLLDALEEYELVVVVNLVSQVTGGSATRAEHVAARRAARTLAEAGRCRAVYMAGCTECGKLVDSPMDRCCGRITHMLTVTVDPTVRSTLIPRNTPAWVSVAPESGGGSDNT